GRPLTARRAAPPPPPGPGRLVGGGAAVRGAQTRHGRPRTPHRGGPVQVARVPCRPRGLQALLTNTRLNRPRAGAAPSPFPEIRPRAFRAAPGGGRGRVPAARIVTPPPARPPPRRRCGTGPSW